jgi:signal transduction histidine kinase
LLLACCLALCVMVERTLLLREARAQVETLTEAARSAGERDALAQLLSVEFAYERSRSVLEAIREGVISVDTVGNVTFANPAAQRAMNMPARSPVGRSIWKQLPAELANAAREAFDAISERATEEDGEHAQVRRSGISCYNRVYDLTAVRVTSARTQQEFGAVFLLVDVTRTHELQRVKDQFLSNVSHELRTPLTNVCAYSELLRNMLPADSSEWVEFATVIHDQGVELSEVVDAMFDFLQLESGEAEFVNEPMDGVRSVQKVVEKRRARASARGIELSLEVEDGAPQLCADRRRVEQVVRQLLDNAIKFSPEGSTVWVKVRGRDGGFEVVVEDAGRGIDPEDRDAVFEKFNQLSEKLTDKPSGTGIGLAASRAIITRLGGLIWCEDAEGGGARFVMLLPGHDQPQYIGSDIARQASGDL